MFMNIAGLMIIIHIINTIITTVTTIFIIITACVDSFKNRLEIGIDRKWNLEFKKLILKIIC